eukprot:9629-Pelagococcus_subviridis.AAC.5
MNSPSNLTLRISRPRPPTTSTEYKTPSTRPQEGSRTPPPFRGASFTSQRRRFHSAPRLFSGRETGTADSSARG